MLTLYIAGPMTGHDDYNRPAFHQAAAQLRAAGYHVISPAETPQPCPDPSWADWTRASLKRMLDADHIATLPGFSRSRGASLETSTGARLGMDYRSVTYWIDRAWVHAPAIHPAGEDQAPRLGYEPIPGGCPCNHPELSGHFDPACTRYCARCNYDSHVCPGCGIDINHDDGACSDCRARATTQEEEPEHRHLYISGRPDCVHCGATDPNLGHYPDDDTNTGPTHQEEN